MNRVLFDGHHRGIFRNVSSSGGRRCQRVVFKFALAILVLFAVAPSPAAAQSCGTSGLNINYGTLNPASSTPTDAISTIQFFCSGLPLFTVRLCVEFGPGSPTISGGYRAMQGGSSLLRHELFTKASRTTIWGSWGSVASSYVPYPNGFQIDTVLGIFGNSSPVVNVYGRVFGGQTGMTAGGYYGGGNHIGVRYGYAVSGGCPTGSGTFTGSANAFATVDSTCTVSATAINFGSVGSLGSNIDTTGTISIQCVNGTAYNIGLSAGTGSGATVAARKMTGGAGSVTYSIYSNSGRTTVWGDTVGSNTVASTGTGSNQNFTTYARVPVQATPPAGTYTDTITVTVTY